MENIPCTKDQRQCNTAFALLGLIMLTSERFKWNVLIDVIFLFPAPCAPVNVSASLVCPNSAHVTWVGSPSATAYNVTAESQDGSILYCDTNSTSCQIPSMHCGQNYTITVTPYADSCAGNPSIPHQFIAGTEQQQDLKSKNDVLMTNVLISNRQIISD